MIIYLLRNAINGKCYVGQTSYMLAKRMRNHRRDAAGLVKSMVSKAIRKYGWENFTVEILEEAEDGFDLDMAERFWIRCYGSLAPNGYNLESGGHGRKTVHADTRAKISRSNMGHVLSEETKAKIGNSNRGRVTSVETREKIRAANIGKTMTPEQIQRSKDNRTPHDPSHTRRLIDHRRNTGVLNWAKVNEIRTKLEAGVRGRILAAQYEVSEGMVSMIGSNKRWPIEEMPSAY